MDRKEFLKRGLLAGSGIYLAPSLLTQCGTTSNIIDSDFDGKVLIIGAGIAGLGAASVLSLNGVEFEILEASSHIGGRIRKLEGFADYDIDLGAEWLHGQRSELANMLSKNGVSVFKDNSDYTFWLHNAFTKELEINFEAELSKTNLPDISVHDLAKNKGWLPDYQYILQAVCSSNGADINSLSAYWNVKEFENWSSGDTDYKFSRTWYDAISELFISKLKGNIRTNTIVESIDYSGNEVSVKTNKNTYHADKVIITVPVTILQKRRISFSPPLSSEKQNAIDKIAMGHGMKIYLKFSEHFFDENIAGGQICAAYADEGYGRSSNDNILLAFVMGTQAQYLGALSEEMAIDLIIKELEGMYGDVARKSFTDYRIQNWGKEEFIQGAYSYSSIGISNAREVAAKTIDKKLYFAGEAMNTNGSFQSVHGAYDTGVNKAKEILHS